MNWKRLRLPLCFASLSRFLQPTRAFVVLGTSRISIRAGASTSSSSTMTDAATSTTETTTSAYDELLRELDAITQLSRVSSILGYDKMVFMPSAAAADRGKQSAALAAVIHEKSTAPKIGRLIDAAQHELEASSHSQSKDAAALARRRRNIQLAKKDYIKATCVPTELAARKAKLSSEAYASWAQARQEDDFSVFVDSLRQCIDTAVEIAKCQQQHDTCDASSSTSSIYSTMLDDYETGMDPARIDAIFADIKAALVPLIDRVLGDTATPPSKDPIQREVAIDKQQELCAQLVQAIGYDTSRGRMDVSVHPFTSASGPSDVRITSRFTATGNWREGLIASLHEAGHAMYEQNLPTCSDGTTSEPVQHALSMGLHESQSIFWERHVGLSQAFWEYAAPHVNDKYGLDYSADEYYGAVNAAGKSFIRVEADELTYPLHVILRYEIERQFVDGNLDAEDIPARWNSEFKKCFGIDVPSDAKGCLQDIHWSMLAYGYFPTYLLGAATAAQLEHYCRSDIPDFQQKIAAGEFVEIKAWLTDKVHKHGKMYNSIDDHLEAQLGEKLNPKYFIDYLTKKYTSLYQC